MFCHGQYRTGTSQGLQTHESPSKALCPMLSESTFPWPTPKYFSSFTQTQCMEDRTWGLLAGSH